MRILKKEIWPFQILVKVEDFSIDEWCEKTFGRRFDNWYSYNIDVEKRLFAFKEESDIVIFKLRWKCNA